MADRNTVSSNEKLVYDLNGNRYVNLTNACTLRCRFCPKYQQGPEVRGLDLSLSRQPDVDTIIAQLNDVTSISEVVFCGFGEPTLRLSALLTIARHVKEAGGYTRLNTDGLGNLVHGRNILPELAPVIDSVSISLNAQDESIYNRHCQPTKQHAYAAVLSFLYSAPRYIKSVTATAIEGLPGVDIRACERIALQAGAHFRARLLDVVG